MSTLPDTYTALDAAYVAALVRGDTEQAGRLGQVLDNPPSPLDSFALCSAALWYGQQGWPVFPLQPGTKQPLPGSHGLKDADTDHGQISAWWTATPDANIGARTGDLYDVIDIDGDQGHQSFTAIVDDGGCPPILGVSVTPRGMHLWVATTGRGNHANRRPGVDYRGTGGYVVVPPSRTPTGNYRWLMPITQEG